MSKTEKIWAVRGLDPQIVDAVKAEAAVRRLTLGEADEQALTTWLATETPETAAERLDRKLDQLSNQSVELEKTLDEHYAQHEKTDVERLVQHKETRVELVRLIRRIEELEIAHAVQQSATPVQQDSQQKKTAVEQPVQQEETPVQQPTRKPDDEMLAMVRGWDESGILRRDQAERLNDTGYRTSRGLLWSKDTLGQFMRRAKK